MTNTRANGTVSNSVAILSLIVGIMALALSVAVVFNGSSRQAQFESNRQLCVDGLASFYRTLTEIQYTDGKLSAGQIADFLADAARARTACFDTKVLDPDTEFLTSWLRTEDQLNTPLAVRLVDKGDVALALLVGNSFLSQLAEGVSEALTSAVEAPGPGTWPWENAVPVVLTTFPPVPVISPLPAP